MPQQQRGPAWLDDYVGVEERLKTFRAAHPKARILTQLLERETLTFRAEIYLEDNETTIPNAVGHASVDGGSGNRKQSPTEKTETAAIGRALTVMGIEGAGEEEREEPQRAQPARPRPVESVQPARSARDYERDILTALDILGKDEEWLNVQARKKYGDNLDDWSDLPVGAKDELLSGLNALVNKKAAETK